MGAHVTVLGNLGADGEVRKVGDQSVLELRIASNSKVRNEEKTQWFRAHIWGTRADKLAPHCTKGSKVLVTGTLEVREYESGGQTKTSLEVRVDQFEFAGGGNKSSGGNNASGGDTGDDSIPFKCRRLKSGIEFYSHPAMGDGLLGSEPGMKKLASLFALLLSAIGCGSGAFVYAVVRWLANGARMHAMSWAWRGTLADRSPASPGGKTCRLTFALAGNVAMGPSAGCASTATDS